MHIFLRALGFHDINTKSEERMLLRSMELSPYHGGPHREEHEYTYAQKRCEVGNGMGVILHGYRRVEDNEFVLEYYYPYMEGQSVTSMESGYVRRHADKESYAVLCEEYSMGSALIFFLTNGMEYREKMDDKENFFLNSFSLTGLSLEGKIILPIHKTEKQIARIHSHLENRNKMLEAARSGDEMAMESLTMDDISIYGQVSRRAMKEDLYSIVDSCFMPTGVECDQYMVIGQIEKVEKIENWWTHQKVYRLLIDCNGMKITIGISKKDLMGEPKVGRRFKGDIWLQGIGKFEEGPGL